MNDPFIIGGVTLTSRLFIGTGKYGADSLIPAVAEASGAQVITVAMRRVDKQGENQASSQGIMGHIPAHMRLLPNTSGARTAEEAVRLARLARADGGIPIPLRTATHRHGMPEPGQASEMLGQCRGSGAGETVLRGDGVHIFPHVILRPVWKCTT